MNKLKKLLAVLLTLCMLTPLFPASLVSALADGEVETIASVDDWNAFASSVNGGNTYSGRTVRLTADVGPVATIVGTSETKSFQGTFDGCGHTLTVELSANADNCSPFNYIKGATITRLRIAGTIETSRKFAAGIAARTYGSCTISLCRSSVVITSTVNGDGTHGGFVGVPEDYCTLTITDCLFDGEMNGSATTKCGGFVGYRLAGATLAINNSLQAGTFMLKNGEEDCATFNRSNNNTDSYSTSYYKTTLGTVQGKDARSMTNQELKTALGNNWAIVDGSVVPILNNKDLCYASISGISDSYTAAAGGSVQMSYTVTAADGNQLVENTHYTVSLTKNGEPCTDTALGIGRYVLTVTAMENTGYTGSKNIPFTVYENLSGAGSETEPYELADDLDWELFANYINEGTAPYADSGAWFRLTADIGTVTASAGTDSHRFKGNLDGNGHTLTVALTASSNDCAPFNYIEGANITRLGIAGTIETSGKYAAGIAAHTYGACTISLCRSSVVITSTVNGDGTHSGFVGVAEGSGTLNISDCLFDGAINGSSTHSCGGFVGWRNSTLNIDHSLQAGAFDLRNNSNISNNDNKNKTFSRNYNDPSDNSTISYYYKTLLGDAQGIDARSMTDQELKTALGNNWEIVDGNVIPSVFAPHEVYPLGSINGLSPAYYPPNTPVTLNYTVTDEYGIQLAPGVYTASLTKNGEPCSDTVLRKGRYVLTVTAKENTDYTGTLSVSFTVYENPSGDGSENKPYLLEDDLDWALFTKYINEGITPYAIKGQRFRLAADIGTSEAPVTASVGTSNNPFKGQLDGNGHTLTVALTASTENCALFNYIEGAGITRLGIAGTIVTSGKYAAGFAANTYGNCTISLCRSSVVITSSVSGDGTHGGFVGVVRDGALNISDCLFDGAINGSDTNNCGGFVGYLNSTLTIERSLQAGTFMLKNGGEGCATFSRGSSSNMTITKSYYVNKLGGEQGVAVGSMSNETLIDSDHLGENWKIEGESVVPKMYRDPHDLTFASINGVQSYYTCGAGGSASISYTVKDFNGDPVDNTVYTVSVTKNGEAYSGETFGKGRYVLTVTAKENTEYTNSTSCSFTVYEQLSGNGYENDPYLIGSMDDWELFALYISSEIDPYAGLGVHYELTADIGSSESPVTVSAGNISHRFFGVFDGGGYTIYANLNNGSEPYTALFPCISGATIMNLTVDGSVTGGDFSAGLVGEAAGADNSVQDCFVKASVSGGASIGGIVGFVNGGISVTGCVFSGAFTGGGNGKGAIICSVSGYEDKEVTNCVYYYHDGDDTTNLDLTRGGNAVTVTNCYKTVKAGSFGFFAYAQAPSDELTKRVTPAGQVLYAEVSVSVESFYEYTGAPITVEPAVTCSGASLEKDTHYTVVTSPGTVQEVGDYTLTVTGLNDGDVYGSYTAQLMVFNGVSYLDENGEQQTLGNNAFTVITGKYLSDHSTALSTGWYVVMRSLTVTSRITVGGDVHLILCDDCELTAVKGINVSSGKSLTIYAQSTGEHEGKLRTGSGDNYAVDNYNAGIGGNGSSTWNVYGHSGSVTINGGVITVQGGGSDGAAGIGGGYKGNNGAVTINGGRVTATGGKCAAGIGGGNVSGGGGTITINGGTVNATGGSSRESNNGGAGIGGGTGGSGGNITINGGTVTANGGKGAAGIGGGSEGSGGNITINGGTVTANGGVSGAGIGSGKLAGGTKSTIKIFGGNVTARGGNGGAGIGSGASSSISGSNEIEIDGGVIEAYGGRSEYTNLYGGAGIGGGNNSDGGSIKITGGKITAKGGSNAGGNFNGSLGIGAGYEDSGSSKSAAIELGLTKADDYINNLHAYKGTVELTTRLHIDGTSTDLSEGTATLSQINGKKLTIAFTQITSSSTALSAGNYKAVETVTIESRVTIDGSVTILLQDGCTLNAQAGILVPDGSSLTIICGEAGTGILNSCGIGALDGNSCGTVVIEGGAVTVTGADVGGTGGAVTISGGRVTADGVTGSTITLGWTNKEDFIQNVGSYTGTVTFVSGFVISGDSAHPVLAPGTVSDNASLNEKKLTPCELIAADTTAFADGFCYAATANVTVSARITVTGSAALILVDGVTLTVPEGIRLSSGNTLNVYGQSADSGKLLINAVTDLNAGIGGNSSETVGILNVYGGDIEVTGGRNSAGIGGGYHGSGGTITISGGSVKATGCDGAGIGGGQGGSGGTIKVSGGSVNAYSYYGAGVGGGKDGSGSEITISGGSVTANGGNNSAGVGGGFGGAGGTVKITSGTVIANGGKNGAGIGGGSGANGGIITISGACTVTATGGDNGAGIGGGSGGSGGEITVSGGSVTAYGGKTGAGIGSGSKSGTDGVNGGTIKIENGVVYALGKIGGAGVGGGNYAPGYSITVSGGEVTAIGGTGGSGIGGGFGANCGTVSISGGTVTAVGAQAASSIGCGTPTGSNYTGGTVNITGGKITADRTDSASSGSSIGNSGAAVNLGWTNADDFIYDKCGYGFAGTVKVASGKVLGDTDANLAFRGTVSESDISLMTGLKLRPAYTVVFNANYENASPSTAALVFARGDETALPSDLFALEDHAISGWNTQADGLGTGYTAGASVADIAGDGVSVTLYAQWEFAAPTMSFVNIEIRNKPNNGGRSDEKQDLRFIFRISLNRTKLQLGSEWYGSGSAMYELTDINVRYKKGADGTWSSNTIPIRNLFSVLPTEITFTVVFVNLTDPGSKCYLAANYAYGLIGETAEFHQGVAVGACIDDIGNDNGIEHPDFPAEP